MIKAELHKIDISGPEPIVMTEFILVIRAVRECLLMKHSEQRTNELIAFAGRCAIKTDEQVDEEIKAICGDIPELVDKLWESIKGKEQ